MIKRETIKQAIVEISKRDPAIGYSLDAMLGTGEIGVPENSDAGDKAKDLFFLFKGQPVFIQKYLYFHEGTVPLEQQLLIKYGELVKKQELQESSDPVDYRRAAGEIHRSALKLLVDHEIDYALSRIRSELAQLESGRDTPADQPAGSENGSAAQSARRSRIMKLDDLISKLEALRQDARPLADHLKDSRTMEDSTFQAEGVVEYVTPARFMPFPFCLDALLQAAAMNLEFFHVRFLLACLIEHTAHRLYACVTGGKILGLIFLELKTHYIKQSLEIKYLATVGGLAQILPDTQLKKIRGVGTFLVAGTWLLWKSCLPKAGELVLNAEIGATRFYRSIGFRPRRPFEYVLAEPAGFLLRSILVMVNACENPAAELLAATGRMLEAQMKRLQKSSRGHAAQVQRKMLFAFLKICLQSRTHPILADRLVRHLFKYRTKLPEASDLLDLAAESGWVRLYRTPPPSVQPLLVACSDQFSRHLENIFHLENAKRIQAVQSVLQHPTLAEKWQAVEPRPAAIEELAWVHTAGHIERVAATAGKPLSVLDPDTQTTEHSYEVALLAVGAVFNLLDAVCSGSGKRGFACIRPPGHHAEPDRAMGFCLFNNAALGARYLQRRCDVERVMIVDIDAHHGNGTQAAFYDSDDVLYVSMHRFPGFPGTGNFGEIGCGRGEGFTVNVPLGCGHGDRDFIEIIHYLVHPLARHFKPGMMLVSCGFDLYLHDRLGGMRATPEAYALMGALLVEIAEQVCGGRIIFIMEGGYSIKGIQACGLYLLQELCSLSPVRRDKLNQITTNPRPKLPALKKAIQIQQRYWPTLSS
ncbi:MAG: histone deacetylase [Desulfobacterales bacterium]